MEVIFWLISKTTFACSVKKDHAICFGPHFLILCTNQVIALDKGHSFSESSFSPTVNSNHVYAELWSVAKEI